MSKSPEIQGLRGVAILLVVTLHLIYAPFNFSPFRFGFLGVQLFFIISGYVVTQSALLSNRMGFFQKRIARIYPPLIIAILLNILLDFFDLVQNKQITSFNILFSGLLLEPRVLNILLDTQIQFIDPVYWTLVVEAKYYFLIGFLIYKLQNRTGFFIQGMSYLSFIFNCFNLSPHFWQSNVKLSTFVNAATITGIHYFSWFTLGMLFLRQKDFSTSKYYLLFFINILASVLQLIQFELAQEYFDSFVPVVGIILIFVFKYRKSKYINRFLISRILVHIGDASYTLYLLHFPMYFALDKVSFYLNFPIGIFRNLVFTLLIIGISIQFEKYFTSRLVALTRTKLLKQKLDYKSK